MSDRDRWQALQAHLREARVAVDAGRTAEALRHVDAALLLDPQFLAAQTLKERILTGSAALVAAPERMAVGASIEPARRLVSPDGLAAFEARARQRRIERRIEAARAAILIDAIADARAAVDEVRELAPDHPELPELEALLAPPPVVAVPAPSPQSHRHPVRWLVAAAALAALAVGGARWARDVNVLRRTPIEDAGVTASDGTLAANAPDVRDAPAAEPTPLPSVPAEPTPTTGTADLPAPSIAPETDAARGDASSRETAATSAPVTSPVASPAASARLNAGAAAPVTPESRVGVAVQEPQRNALEPPRSGPLAPSTPLPAVSSATAAQAPPPSVQSLSPSQVTAVTEQPMTPPAPASNAPLSANNGSVAASNGSLTAGNGSLAAGNGSVAPGNGSVAASNGSVGAGTAPAAAPSSAFRVDDEQLVKQTLQRYRMAYEDRDASRARTVWPGVNQSALQRAFDGLESQRLTFDACDVQLRGTSATATCRGTLQYVPKVGSREVRTEPRIWNFNLQKSGDSWAIQNARADR